MTGTVTCLTISGTARAAASVLTVTRTSSLPAAWSALTWATVPATSAVSVLVIDCTMIGRGPPTLTPPTSTEIVLRRCGALMAVMIAPHPRSMMTAMSPSEGALVAGAARRSRPRSPRSSPSPGS